MSRVRSTSIYTKREPAKVAEDLPNMSSDPSDFDLDLPQLILKKNHSAGLDDISFDDFGPLCESTCKDNFMGDFKPLCTKSEESSPTLASSTASRGSNSSHCSSMSPLEMADLEDALKHQHQHKIFRGMAIGARDTGKRTLIEAMFKGSHGERYQEKKKLDLMIRTVETDDECVEKYHFWIKEPIDDVNIPQCILDTYYTNCSVFFAVYDADDRASFECLDTELELLRKAKKNREDVVILVGNKKKEDCGKKTVVQKEITALKHKHKIALFLEIDIKKQTPSELSSILQGYLKEIHCLFER